MDPRLQFKNLLKKEEIVVAPGCHDPLSAKIIESLGFKCVSLGGWAVGAQLGITEPLTTLTEMVMVSKYIVDWIKIPLIVDAGAGFGDINMVSRTIREFEKAGVAAIHLEDQVVPKRSSYHKGVHDIIPAEKMVEKIKVALDAREDPNFFIFGRTDAGRNENESFDEAIERANIYAKNGMDLIEVFPRNIEEIKRAPREIETGVMYVASEGKRLAPNIKDLESFGYKIVNYPFTSVLAMTHETRKVYSNLMQTGKTGYKYKECKEIVSDIKTMLSLEDSYKIEESFYRR